MKLLSKRWAFHSSILFQILFFMILVAVIPLLVSSWTFIDDYKNKLRTHLLTLNFTVTQNATHWIRDFNNSLKNELDAFCAIQTGADIPEEQQDILSNIIVSQENNIDVIWVRTTTSRIYNDSNRPISAQLKEFVLNQENYHAILAGNVIVSDPFLSAAPQADSALQLNDSATMRIVNNGTPPGETLILFGLPLWARGQPIGAVYAEINLTPIRRFISDMDLYRPESEIFVVDHSGRVLAHKNEMVAIELSDFSQHQVVKQILDLQRIIRRDKVNIPQSQNVVAPDGREMLASIQVVPEPDWGRETGERSYLGWGVIAQQPKEAAFYPIYEMSQKIKQYSAITIFLAIAFAGFLAIRLTRPILLLTQGAEQIAAGNYDTQVMVKAKNEIGVLATSFNYMTSQIQKYMAELKLKAWEIKELFFSSMETIVAAIDARDPYTRGHSLRVTTISVEIGNELRLSEDDLEKLKIAAMLHDVGKIGIRDCVLLKKGKLTADEFTVIKTHPVLGATIMEPIKLMEKIIPGMKYHHEWWDGTGYPKGRKGEEIPLYARIIAIADTFDAMTSDRPYQKKMDHDFVVGKIKGWAGSRYDPVVVEAFLRVYRNNKIPKDEISTVEVEKVIP